MRYTGLPKGNLDLYGVDEECQRDIAGYSCMNPVCFSIRRYGLSTLHLLFRLFPLSLGKSIREM
jgi:hypothetical protein